MKLTKYDIRCWKEAFERCYPNSLGNHAYEKLLKLLKITRKKSIQIEELKKKVGGEMKIKDMPKLQSPFVRKETNEGYVVTPVIEKGYNWVFEDESVMAIEKLHGTNVSIIIQEGTVISIFNRTERIPFINKGKAHIIEGLLESKRRGFIDKLMDGQHFGELIGPKVNGNPYKLEKHVWIPFETYAQEHLKYKSWGKYPKDFETISRWFKKDLLPLFALKRGDKEGFVEGIVFTHPDGRMAKLRKDMFSWYKGKRHKVK